LKPDADAGPIDAPVEQVADAHDAGDASDAPVEMPAGDAVNDLPAGDVVNDASTVDTTNDVPGDGKNEDGGVVSGSWQTAYVCEVFGWNGAGSVALSPDGNTVALGGSSVKVVSVASGQVLATYQALAGVVQSVAFSPDGTTLVAAGATPLPGGAGYAVAAWRTSDKTVLWGLPGDAPSPKVAFSRDGTMVAIAGKDGVRLVRASTGEAVATFRGHPSGANYAVFSPDGTTVASTDLSQTVANDNILLWRVSDLAVVRSLSAAGWANQPAFSPDGTQLLVSGGSGFTRFKVSDGTVIQNSTGGTGSVAWAPDGGTFFVGGAWRTSDGLLIRSVAAARDAAFTPDGQRVLMVPGLFWSVANGSQSAPFNAGSPLQARQFVVADNGSITFLAEASPGAVSPDGRLLAAPPTGAGAPTDQIRITRVADQSLVAILVTGSSRAIAWSPDGTRLVTGRHATHAGDLLFWNTATWTIERSMPVDVDFTKVVYAPDGKSLLANGSAESVVFDVADGRRRASFPLSAYMGCTGAPYDASYSPDGAFVATATLFGTYLWSPVDGHLVTWLPSPSDYQVAITSFGAVTLGQAAGVAGGAVAYRWCPGPAPASGSDGGVTGDGGTDGAGGIDGGPGACTEADRAKGDFDGDGIVDCVVLRAPDIYFYKGQTGATFSATPVYSARAVSRSFVGISTVFDMNGDNRADLVYFDRQTSGTNGFFAPGRADGTFRSPGFCSVNGLFYASGAFSGGPAGDFTNDGKTDIIGMSIVAAGPYGEPVVFSLGAAGAGSGETGYPMKVGFGSRGSADIGSAGDVDGDGYRDAFVVTHPVGLLNDMGPNQVYVAWGNGSGELFSRTTNPQPISSLAGATSIATGELNGDGKLDLLVSFDFSPPSHRYLGDGKGGFTPAP
jgi:WD40 repeat protein